MAIRATRRKIAEAVVALLERGRSVGSVAKVVAEYLAKNRMTRDIDLLMRDIQMELIQREGLVVANVVSAQKLSEKLRKEIQKFVLKSTEAKEVEMIERVDKNLIGGIVVTTAEAEMDISVRTKLRKLKSI